jgi:hypothetical protein
LLKDQQVISGKDLIKRAKEAERARQQIKAGQQKMRDSKA